jgi:hypothetical protein
LKIVFKRFGWLVLAIFALAIGWWWVSGRQAASGVEILTSPPAHKGSRLAVLGSWAHPVRRQLLRIKYWLIGPPAVVTVEAKVVRFSGTEKIFSRDLSLSSPTVVDTNGLRAWLVTSNDIVILEKLFDQSAYDISRSASTAPSGMRSEMSHGTTFLIFLARAARQHVDLTSFITTAEVVTNQATVAGQPASVSLRTNAAFGSVVQLPNGRGAFLLNSPDETGRVTGVLLTTRVEKPKR